VQQQPDEEPASGPMIVRGGRGWYRGGGGGVRARSMSQPPLLRGRFDVRTGPHGPRGF